MRSMYYERLKYLREEKDLTLYYLSEYLKLNREVYGQYEREYVIMPIKHLISICNFFNVSLDYVFNFNNNRQYINCIKEVDWIKAGSRLKEFRQELKLTQEKLAKKLNIARSIIGEYEKGNFPIATHTLYDVCKKYKISADYLLGRIDEPKYLK